jgi:aquaporin Z
MQKYLVEFIGTLFFLFTILATGNPLAIASALYISIMIGGNISGGHFNPAVSVMMTFAGKLAKKDLPLYLLAQILGGLTAWCLLSML